MKIIFVFIIILTLCFACQDKKYAGNPESNIIYGWLTNGETKIDPAQFLKLTLEGTRSGTLDLTGKDLKEFLDHFRDTWKARESSERINDVELQKIAELEFGWAPDGKSASGKISLGKKTCMISVLHNSGSYMHFPFVLNEEKRSTVVKFKNLDIKTWKLD